MDCGCCLALPKKNKQTTKKKTQIISTQRRTHVECVNRICTVEFELSCFSPDWAEINAFPACFLSLLFCCFVFYPLRPLTSPYLTLWKSQRPLPLPAAPTGLAYQQLVQTFVYFPDVHGPEAKSGFTLICTHSPDNFSKFCLRVASDLNLLRFQPNQAWLSPENISIPLLWRDAP